jgi:hypothetical protein
VKLESAASRKKPISVVEYLGTTVIIIIIIIIIIYAVSIFLDLSGS